MFPSLLPLLLPPFFSSILAIILKSPPDIQSGYNLFELSSDKVSRISALCMVSWGKHRFVIWRWVVVLIMWNIDWMKFLFSCILSSWITHASQRTASPPNAPCASTVVTSPPVQAFATNFSKTVELHFVSCKKSMVGFSCMSMFFRSLPFLRPLSPLIFHISTSLRRIGIDIEVLGQLGISTWLN